MLTCSHSYSLTLAIYYCQCNLCRHYWIYLFYCHFIWVILADLASYVCILCVIGKTGSKWKCQNGRENTLSQSHSTLCGEKQTTRGQSAACWHDGSSQTRGDGGNHHDSSVCQGRWSKADTETHSLSGAGEKKMLYINKEGNDNDEVNAESNDSQGWRCPVGGVSLREESNQSESADAAHRRTAGRWRAGNQTHLTLWQIWEQMVAAACCSDLVHLRDMSFRVGHTTSVTGRRTWELVHSDSNKSHSLGVG